MSPPCLPLGLKCLAALLDFHQLTAVNLENLYDMSLVCVDSYMRLDLTAVKSMNLMPVREEAKQFSVYGVLNHCKTGVCMSVCEREKEKRKKKRKKTKGEVCVY